jgi:hypothetical protein
MAPAAPKTAEDFRARAASCDRVAESAIIPKKREIMRYLAARWRAFADEGEAKRGLSDRPAQPLPSGEGAGDRENSE